ncbi:MAG: peptide ABC transporter ATP-binding protein, partial [Lacticaseibacillus paracasei]
MTEPLLTMNDLSVTFYKGRQAIKAVDQINF